jgi:hypothetical protein
LVPKSASRGKDPGSSARKKEGRAEVREACIAVKSTGRNNQPTVRRREVPTCGLLSRRFPEFDAHFLSSRVKYPGPLPSPACVRCLPRHDRRLLLAGKDPGSPARKKKARLRPGSGWELSITGIAPTEQVAAPHPTLRATFSPRRGGGEGSSRLHLQPFRIIHRLQTRRGRNASARNFNLIE